MPQRTKREWLLHLDIAQKAYEKELAQMELKQRTITSYFRDSSSQGERTRKDDGKAPPEDDPGPEPD